jgi:hypothetical protein
VDVELVVEVHNVYLHRGHLGILKVRIALLLAVMNHAFQRTSSQHAQLRLLLMRDDTMLLHLNAGAEIKILTLSVIHQKR